MVFTGETRSAPSPQLHSLLSGKGIVLLGVLCVSAVKKDLLAGSPSSRLEVLVLGVPLRHDLAPFPSPEPVVVSAWAVIEPGLHVHPHAAVRIALHLFSGRRLRSEPRLNGGQPPACRSTRRLHGPLNRCGRLRSGRSARRIPCRSLSRSRYTRLLLHAAVSRSQHRPHSSHGSLCPFLPYLRDALAQQRRRRFLALPGHSRSHGPNTQSQHQDGHLSSAKM